LTAKVNVIIPEIGPLVVETLRWLVHVSGTACRLSSERWTVVSVLLCRDSRHFYSAVSASADFFRFCAI